MNQKNLFVRSFLRVLLLLCSVLPASGGLAAEGAQAFLRVAVFDIPPYASQARGATPEGLYVELLRAIAAQAGYAPQIQLAPFARTLAKVSGGVADLTISFPTDGSTNPLIALEPLLKVEVIVVPRKGVVAGDRSALAQRRIGRIRGGCIDLAYASELHITFFELNSFAEGLRLLALGRIDGLCTTREVFRYYLARDGWKAAEFGEAFVINRREAWLFLRPDAPADMQQRLRGAVQELRRRKQIEGIVARYTAG